MLEAKEGRSVGEQEKARKKKYFHEHAIGRYWSCRSKNKSEGFTLSAATVAVILLYNAVILYCYCSPLKYLLRFEWSMGFNETSRG